jgi:hypothetical protein
MQTVPATTDNTTTPDADYDDGAPTAPVDGCCCDDCIDLRAAADGA